MRPKDIQGFSKVRKGGEVFLAIGTLWPTSKSETVSPTQELRAGRRVLGCGMRLPVEKGGGVSGQDTTMPSLGQ